MAIRPSRHSFNFQAKERSVWQRPHLWPIRWTSPGRIPSLPCSNRNPRPFNQIGSALSCFHLCSYHLGTLHHGMPVCPPKGHLICEVDQWMKPPCKPTETQSSSDSPPSAREGADRPLKTSASGTQPNHACRTPNHLPNSRRLERYVQPWTLSIYCNSPLIIYAIDQHCWCVACQDCTKRRQKIILWREAFFSSSISESTLSWQQILIKPVVNV